MDEISRCWIRCPDWPGCYGFVVFPTTEAEVALAESRFPEFPYDINKAIPEVVHRYFAAVLGLFAIALTAISFRAKDSGNLKWWSLGLLIFILLPRLFGYLTVSLKLLPIIVTSFIWWIYNSVFILFIFLKQVILNWLIA